MFKKILIPVDLSQKHQKAFDAAVEIAREFAGEIILLHVIEVIAGVSMDEDKSFYRRLEKKAHDHLESLKATLKAAMLPSSGEILYGHRGPEIVRYAEKNAIDLIVLTTPPLESESLGTGLGSLSHKVGMFAQCPVLLVRGV
jgi:nucleotide-binding universal stress UspA family protein